MLWLLIITFIKYQRELVHGQRLPKIVVAVGHKVFKHSQKKNEKNMVNISIQVKCAYLISSKEQSHITETSAIS